MTQTESDPQPSFSTPTFRCNLPLLCEVSRQSFKSPGNSAMHRLRLLSTLCALATIGGVALRITKSSGVQARSAVTVTPATAHDVSDPLIAVDAAATNDGNAADQPEPDRASRVMAVEPNESWHGSEAAGLPVIT